MALAWTTTELLADIRAQARLSDDDPDATDALLLGEATRQLHRVFVPMIRAARSEYYQAYSNQALVAAQAAYDIPARSATSSVRAVLIVDSAGTERVLTPYPSGDRHDYTSRPGVPAHYTVVDDQLYLLPAPSSTALGTLRVVYEYRPGQLVLPAVCQAVVSATAVVPGAVTSTCTVTTASGSSPALVSPLDVVRATPPFSLAAVSASSVLVTNTFTLTASGTLRLPRAGDWLCNAGETPIPQIPPEYHPLLALATAASYLAPIDPALSSDLDKELKAALLVSQAALSPRQQGAQIKIKSRTSYMRGGRRGGRRTFGDWT